MKKIFIIIILINLYYVNFSCNKDERDKDQGDIVGLWFFEAGSGGTNPLSYTEKVYEKYYSNKTWFYFPQFDNLCIIKGDKSCEFCPDRVYASPTRPNTYVSDTLNYWIKGDKLIRERRIDILDRNSEIILDTLVVEKITDPLLTKRSKMRKKPWNLNAVNYYNNKFNLGKEVTYSKIVYSKNGCFTRSP